MLTLADQLAAILDRPEVELLPPDFDPLALAHATTLAWELIAAGAAPELAGRLGELAGLHYAAGAETAAEQLLEQAQRLAPQRKDQLRYRAAPAEPASFMVLCRAAILERRGRGSEADALVLSHRPLVVHPEMRRVFQAY